MFDLWCPVAGCRVLRWWSDVVAVAHPTGGAIDVLIRCECGALAVRRTGRAREGDEATIHGIAPDVRDDRALGGVGAPR